MGDSMKHASIAMVVILLVSMAMVLSGCSAIFMPKQQKQAPEAAIVEGTPQEGQEAGQPDAQGTQPVETNAYGEEVRPAQKTTTVRQPMTREGATEQPVPFDRRLEGEMLTLDAYKLSRTSRDKGLVEGITFTVRNTGSKTLSPRVILWFKTQSVSDASIPDVTEKDYDLPQLEPGYKVTKTYPLNVRFHYLEEQKVFTLKLRERFVSPPKDLTVITKSFIPIEEMETMEISWT